MSPVGLEPVGGYLPYALIAPVVVPSSAKIAWISFVLQQRFVRLWFSWESE